MIGRLYKANTFLSNSLLNLPKFYENMHAFHSPFSRATASILYFPTVFDHNAAAAAIHMAVTSQRRTQAVTEGRGGEGKGGQRSRHGAERRDGLYML